jgi:hypothetical protein
VNLLLCRAAALDLVAGYSEAFVPAGRLLELHTSILPLSQTRVILQQAAHHLMFRAGCVPDPEAAQPESGLPGPQHGTPQPPQQRGIFGPQFVTRLATDPLTMALFDELDFRRMLQLLQEDCDNVGLVLHDPRMQLVCTPPLRSTLTKCRVHVSPTLPVCLCLTICSRLACLILIDPCNLALHACQPS